MRGALWVATLLLLAPLAGCIGGVDEQQAAEDLDSSAADADLTEISTDHSQPADAAGNLVSALPSSDIDPLAAGPFEVDRAGYDFGHTVVRDSETGVTYPAKLTGSVTYPTETEGPHPIVVLLHGRHYTCDVAGSPQLGTQACPDVGIIEPIDSYRGYAYLAETLASHGFVVASVDANDVNDRDLLYQSTDEDSPLGERYVADLGVRARAQLALRTLDGFEQINAGQDPAPAPGTNDELVDVLTDSIDLERVGLVGHSRGGDGVGYAVTYNNQRTQGDPHAISAVFAIAPTDFRDTTVSGVPYAILAPYCDGDVFDLQGVDVFDRSRYGAEAGPLYQYVAMGANHAFYNTVWTDNIDDASGYEDPFCGDFREDGGGRLSPEDQRRHGEALVNAFLRAHVTDEARFDAWLQGRSLTPPEACPGGEDACASLIHTSYHPPSGDRLVVESLADGEATEENDLGGEVRLEGALDADVCSRPECPSSPNRQLATQLTLSWDDEGRYVLAVPDEHRDASAYAWLSMRVGVNFDDPANADRDHQDVSIGLVDETGERVAVPAQPYGHALFVPPGQDGDGSGSAEVTLNAVRVPLAAFDGVDDSRLEAIEIVTDRTAEGSIQVSDIMLQT